MLGNKHMLRGEDGVWGIMAGNKRSIRKGWLWASHGKLPGRRDSSTETATALPKVINNCLIASFQPKGLSSVFTLCDFSAGLDSAPCLLLHSFSYLPNIYWEYSLCADEWWGHNGGSLLFVMTSLLIPHLWPFLLNLLHEFIFLSSVSPGPCPPWSPSNFSYSSDFEKSLMTHKSLSLNATFLPVSIVYFQWLPGYLTWGWGRGSFVYSVPSTVPITGTRRQIPSSQKLTVKWKVKSA